MDAPDQRHPLFADLAVDGARAPLTYSVPDHWRDEIETGSAVWVPLRNRWAVGVVLRLHAEAPPFPTKPFQGPTAPPVVLDEVRLEAARWLARETASDPYSALAPFLPPGIAQGSEECLRLVEPRPDGVDLTPAQSRLAALLDTRGETPIAAARTALKSSLASIIPKLEEAGVIERTMRALDRTPARARRRASACCCRRMRPRRLRRVRRSNVRPSSS